MDSLKVFHWKYDDRSVGTAWRLQSEDGSKTWIKFCYFANKSKYRQAKKAVKKAVGTEYESCKFKKCTIPCGLDAMRPSDFLKKNSKKTAKGIEAVEELLGSCGKDIAAKRTMLNLVSAILSGYCARVGCDLYDVDHLPADLKRAPVISVKYADYAYPVLSKIVGNLAVKTSVVQIEDFLFPEKCLKEKYYPVLPHTPNESSILDSAYLKLPKLPHALMPQYRDTTILLHCRFFPGSEIAKFQKVNPWVSMVLFDAPGKKLFSTPVRVDGAVLARSDCSWDDWNVYYATERFVSYLSRKSRSKRWKKRVAQYFLDFEEIISRNNVSVNNTPVKRAQKFQISLQMLALRLFLDACKADDGISEEKAQTLLADWYNTLFPGCCTKDVQQKWEPAEEESESFQLQFERAICSILQEDDFKHIYYVAKGNICPERSEDGKTEYRGYVKMYQKKDENKTTFLSLQFRRDTFDKLFKTHCPDYAGKNWFKDVEELGCEYIEAVKARMYPDETAPKVSKDALLLNIAIMHFLPSEVRQKLYDLAGYQAPDGTP